MDIETSQPVLEQTASKMQAENSYLFIKLLEAFEFTAERTVDVFTYSKFLEFYGRQPKDQYEKTFIENYIHQLRVNLRQDFKSAFFELTVKHKIKETLSTITFELEKSKILKEFDAITDNLFSQGQSYYFQFLAGVVERLKEANKEVNICNTDCQERMLVAHYLPI